MLKKNAGLYPFPKGINYHVKCDSGGLKMLKIQHYPSGGESVECGKLYTLFNGEKMRN